jgi:hypothetical protein
VTLKPRALVRHGPAPSGIAVTNVDKTDLLGVPCDPRAIRRKRAQVSHDRLAASDELAEDRGLRPGSSRMTH